MSKKCLRKVDEQLKNTPPRSKVSNIIVINFYSYLRLYLAKQFEDEGNDRSDEEEIGPPLPLTLQHVCMYV